MPQKKNEILVEKDYLSKQGIDAKIGDKIVLPGENTQEGQEFVISGYIKNLLQREQIVLCTLLLFLWNIS
mgnify:CR=1 FL=1